MINFIFVLIKNFALSARAASAVAHLVLAVKLVLSFGAGLAQAQNSQLSKHATKRVSPRIAGQGRMVLSVRKPAGFHTHFGHQTRVEL